MAVEPEFSANVSNCNEKDEDDFSEQDSVRQLKSITDRDSENEKSLNIHEKSLSDDEASPTIMPRKRTQRFSDNDSDGNDKINQIENLNVIENVEQLPENTRTLKGNKKSRIRIAVSSESDHHLDNTSDQENGTINIKYKSNRIENKGKKLRNKFKNLVSHTKNNLKVPSDDENIEKLHYNGSEDSDNDSSSLKIKQKVAANTMKSICDPDTSDEEDIGQAKINKRKSKPKIIKSTSPKPLRMSSKQAMENMQKIKSESNRMLREKEVSLPYHRPKALTLKDIMNRRRTTVSSDGKSLPIKMNESQLREYAMLLEQRQKEVIELCKSDTEEEDKEDEPKDEINENTNNKVTINESNNSPDVSTSIETISEILLIQNKEKEDLRIEQSMEDNVHMPDKQSEILEPLFTEADSLNNDNTNNTNDEILKVDDNVQYLQENIVLQKETADESQNISLHYDSELFNTENQNECNDNNNDNKEDDDFSDCEINMDEIEKIIREAKIICEQPDTPKLTGAPGTVINLENEDLSIPRKLSGVELLKERFQFFAKLKTQEDLEKDREKKFKPGTQHLKLRHELEQQIAEQRSIEWEKRLQEEKQLKSEMNVENDEDDIEKLENKLQDIDKEEIESDSSESEEELVENDVIMEDKPLKRNPMLDDEADVSDCEKGDDINDDADFEDDESNEELDSGESSSDSEDDSKPKKSRILKAFEDSDDEKENEVALNDDVNKTSTQVSKAVNSDSVFNESQDDLLPLAQGNKSSDDLFSTQSTIPETSVLNKNTKDNNSTEISTQTICVPNTDPSKLIKMDINPDNMIVYDSQSQNEDVCMDGIVGMCSGSFSQNLVSSQMQPSLTQPQELSDDIAIMCTGKFYDNPLVSQEKSSELKSIDISKDLGKDTSLADIHLRNDKIPVSISNVNKRDDNKENTILNSIIDELGDLDEKPKQYKYFANDTNSRDPKKKFTIESDDESNLTSPKKIKKLKKRKAEQRALHISDDEDEVEDVESDIGENENEDRIVEYDSEENEIEVKKPKTKPLKKGIRDFFENEAELTSEDEWIGSGDEDERGLDTMEREDGDDETFHQGKLRRELGQIHMREVLDQDKREVRLIQELLFEDGDLGDGHRQRKFRWKNADGEEETGMNLEEITDTQEDEFESEEQWRKERHEREMFIRKMRETDEVEKNTTINRSTIIKANLCSRSMSSLISEIKTTKTEEIPVPVKKTAKDIPSPKKSFTMFQQNYHTSLLTRGRGALTRLAALATPLADDDTPRNISTSRGNFVFAAITPDGPKVTKRKADKMIHTPRLIKKMKTDVSNKQKPTLFDHIKI